MYVFFAAVVLLAAGAVLVGAVVRGSSTSPDRLYPTSARGQHRVVQPRQAYCGRSTVLPAVTGMVL